jgi:hypothetical protein
VTTMMTVTTVTTVTIAGVRINYVEFPKDDAFPREKPHNFYGCRQFYRVGLGVTGF